MKQGSRLSSVSNALQSLRNGEFVVVMDDESRENEGDLVIAAQFATEQQLAFMVRHTNGILCVTMPEKRSEQLGLPCMIPDNQVSTFFVLQNCALLVSLCQLALASSHFFYCSRIPAKRTSGSPLTSLEGG